MSEKQVNKPVEKPKEKRELLTSVKNIKPGQQILHD